MTDQDYDIIVEEIPPVGNRRFEAKVRWHGEGKSPVLGIVWGDTHEEAMAKMQLKVDRHLSTH